MARKRREPRCIVIAGPNGAGKTTFAREYLPSIAGLIHFVNVDLIAGGISPLRPELAAITAGRLVLCELDRLVESKADCDFEIERPNHLITHQHDIECLNGKLLGSEGTLYLTKQIVGFVGEKDDPQGKWIVRITIKDLNRPVNIPLETSFTLQ
jgi:hypothetical protein